MSNTSRGAPIVDDVPGEPSKEPDLQTDGYDVYVYESDEMIVPQDIYVVETDENHGDDEPYMKFWVFEGTGPMMRFTTFITHQYGPTDEPSPNDGLCCKMWTVAEGVSIDDVPDDVSDIVARVSDAPVVYPGEQ